MNASLATALTLLGLTLTLIGLTLLNRQPGRRQLPDWTDDPHSYYPEYADIVDRLPDLQARMTLIAAGQEPDQP